MILNERIEPPVPICIVCAMASCICEELFTLVGAQQIDYG
jgi:hypothetical protein